MNILFVSAVLPYPLHSGGQIRIYQLLKRLSKQHEITLVSFIRDERERAYVSDLGVCKRVYMVHRGYAWQPKYILGTACSSFPFLLATYDNARMRLLLQKILAADRYDRIHLEPFYVWPSLPHTSIPVVVSEHNIEYSVYERYVATFRLPLLRPLLSWDVGKLFSWERTVWRRAAAVTAVSTDDATIIETYLSHDVAVVPNGVDLSMFQFQPPPTISRKRAVFVGNFRWLPNRQAADELVRTIWPAILRKHPHAELTIAGRHIPSEIVSRVQALGGRIQNDVLDITAVYHDADVLLAPHAIAGGTKYKMLEAMASGLPIVTSAHGMAGLLAEPDVHYLEARTTNEYVDAVTDIWEHAKVRERISREARRLVEKNYTWDIIARELGDVWKHAHR